MASRAPAEVYRFGRFRLDVVERVFERDGSRAPVMPKVFDLLVVLIRNRGRLLSKDELLRTVWPETFVDEGSLSRTMSRLRTLLGETQSRPVYVETLSKSGYRFIADVVVDRAPDARTLAILPFQVMSSDPDSAFLGLAIADALITRLSHIRALHVRPTSSIAPYAAQPPRVSEAGARLEASTVLEGRVQLHQGRARVTVQLVRVEDEAPFWGDTFEEPSLDLYALQDRIATRVAGALALRVSEREAAAMSRVPQASALSYEMYLRARAHTLRFDPEGILRAIELYEKIIAAEPAFAAARAALAATLLIASGTFLPQDEVLPRARKEVAAALRADESLAEAHFSSSMIQFWHDHEIAAAERSLQRGLELAPNDPFGHHLFAWQLCARGEFERARTMIERAVMLDPATTPGAVDLGYPDYFGRDYSRALTTFERAAARDPNFWYPHYFRGLALLALARHGEALAAFERVVELAGNAVPEAHTAIELAKARAGQPARMTEAGALTDRAALAVAIDRRDEAIALLERALEASEKWIMWIGVDPRFDPIREDARFARVRGTLGI